MTFDVLMLCLHQLHAASSGIFWGVVRETAGDWQLHGWTAAAGNKTFGVRREWEVDTGDEGAGGMIIGSWHTVALGANGSTVRVAAAAARRTA